MGQKPTSVIPVTSAVSKQQIKQPWRKPTITFVPLHITANSAGSGADAQTIQSFD